MSVLFSAPSPLIGEEGYAPSNVLLFAVWPQYEVVVYDSQTGKLTRHIPERGAVSFRVSPNISL